MEEKNVRKFQSILAAAGIPVNPATAEVILTFANVALEDANLSIDEINNTVNSINKKYIKPEMSAKPMSSPSKMPLKKI